MKNLNESLLESIDLIQEASVDAELEVCSALINEYYKQADILAYADESVVNEFAIIQEGFFMEADAPRHDPHHPADHHADDVPLRRQHPERRLRRGAGKEKSARRQGRKIRRTADLLPALRQKVALTRILSSTSGRAPCRSRRR